MVKLTKIYTKTGDKGLTSLGNFQRIQKTDPRVRAMSSVDELNAHIGLVLLQEVTPQVRKLLDDIQNDLFDLGADLCTPVEKEPEVPPLRIEQGRIEWLEKTIDQYNKNLSKLRSFILPAGTRLSSHLHVCRTITRRAELDAWVAYEEFGDAMNVLTTTYLNRLSDLMFVLARGANKEFGEVLWVPGQNRGDNE
jgi:cob(I)alamin adenosyltransferase